MAISYVSHDVSQTHQKLSRSCSDHVSSRLASSETLSCQKKVWTTCDLQKNNCGKLTKFRGWIQRNSSTSSSIDEQPLTAWRAQNPRKNWVVPELCTLSTGVNGKESPAKKRCKHRKITCQRNVSASSQAIVQRQREGVMTVADLLRMSDVQTRLAASRSTVYRLIEDGQIERVFIGSSPRIVDESVDNYIAQLRLTPESLFGAGELS